jgi:hypothetical protein
MENSFYSKAFLEFCIVLLISFAGMVNVYPSVPIQVWPSEIQFNFEEGNANDAILVSTYNYPIYSAEWSNNVQTYIPAYIRNQTNRKISVSFSSNYSGIAHLMLKLTVTSGEGLGDICILFVPNYTIGNPVVLDLAGAIPGTTGKKSFTWQWEIYGIPSDLTNFYPAWKTTNTNHTYYTLFDIPKAPMLVPWVEVLEYACNWADGQNSDGDVLSEITSHLYYSGFIYDQYFSYTSNNQFKLNRLLQDIPTLETVKMDCRDFSNFLLVLSNSLGLNVQYNKIGPPFYYNYLLPAGFSSPVHDQLWTYHQVGWYNSEVADASTQLDFDDYPMIPPNDPWRLCVGDVSLPLYLDKLTEYNNVVSVETGICEIVVVED